ncbi:hypothetical protein GFS24_10365 [Chitinophaga sp. SYP-B3965]|uniref:hypothetical protein n=1 Tax=Chitinophaga sp. SYP-B3965 TaxID=2663120 RepID=UPI00129962D8|nr:hypothetical protein [Chitinophaga sp. SYP-B3965]MRG45520.1 hypothetical protein [Chitinophaga sp. SYP-B3965]
MQFLDYLGVKEGAFEKKLNFSNAYFSKTREGRGNIAQKELEKIHQFYPELSIIWLIFGEGEMILPGANKLENIAQKAHKKNIPQVVNGGIAQVNAQKGAQDLTGIEENCPVCAEKEKAVEILERLIKTKDQTIADKEQIIAEKDKNIKLLEHILNPEKAATDENTTSKVRKKVG